MITLAATAQATYYLLTGIWPIVSINTFQKVTGPKTDLWLVKTVGTLFAVIGLAIAVAVWQGEIDTPIAVLAIACCIGVIIIDVVYVATRTISPIYLLDALAELILLIAWGIGLWANSQ